MSWDLKFAALIAVPQGQPLATLRDAALYITALPSATQQKQVWRDAIQALFQAADQGGPTTTARLCMIHAIYPSDDRGDDIGPRGSTRETAPNGKQLVGRQHANG